MASLKGSARRRFINSRRVSREDSLFRLNEVRGINAHRIRENGGCLKSRTVQGCFEGGSQLGGGLKAMFGSLASMRAISCRFSDESSAELRGAVAC